MQIHLSDILGIPDGAREYTAPLGFDSFSFQGSVYPVTESEPVFVRIHHGNGRKLTIRARVSLTLQVPCDRCLKPVDVPFSFTSKTDVDMDMTDEDRIRDLDEAVFIEGHTLDVDKLVEDELFVRMPMKVLCSDDCEGLTGMDDTISESETCDDESAVPDPRMAAIRDIFQNANPDGSKEV